VLRGVCGPGKDEVTGGWRKLHNVELHKLYSLPKIITIKTKRMLKSRLVARMGKSLYKILV
jgi:hypothetical protein